MIILYALLIAYILAVNFYAFLLVKGLRDRELENQEAPDPARKTERNLGKLFAAGTLGGAITIYVCMFLFKYKRSDLLLMLAMPLLGVLNIYIFVILFRSGFSFLLIK